MMNEGWADSLRGRLSTGPPMTAVEIMEFVGYTTTTANGLQHASDAVTRVKTKVKLRSHRSPNPNGTGQHLDLHTSGRRATRCRT